MILQLVSDLHYLGFPDMEKGEKKESKAHAVTPTPKFFPLET